MLTQKNAILDNLFRFMFTLDKLTIFIQEVKELLVKNKKEVMFRRFRI